MGYCFKARVPNWLTVFWATHAAACGLFACKLMGNSGNKERKELKRDFLITTTTGNVNF